MQTVICMKWGTAYGADYANTLYSMVSRNTARPLRFVCFTDDVEGFRPEIEPRPLPADRPPAKPPVEGLAQDRAAGDARSAGLKATCSSSISMSS